MTMAITSLTAPEALKVKTSTSMQNQLLRKHSATPPMYDRQERTSFASFTEDRDAIAQSFIDSRISSYARASEEAIEDALSPVNTTAEHGIHYSPTTMPLTTPSSALHGFICPCEGFRGWKQISVGGRAASRSFGDLRALNKGFTWDVQESKGRKVKTLKNDAGHSLLERLPMELLSTSLHLLPRILRKFDIKLGN
jgi:hypothetical protein